MQTLAFIVALPLLFTGCASMHRFSPDIVSKREPLPPYWATGIDVALVVSAPVAAAKGDDMIFQGSTALLLGGMALVDIPLALVTDTLCLPFDGYAYLRYPGDVRFWDDFFTNSTPLVTSRTLRRRYTKHTTYFVENKIQKMGLSANQVSHLLSAGIGVKQLAQTAVTNAETAWALHRYAEEAGGEEGYLIQMRLASNPASPEDLLDVYAHHSDLGRVRAAAGNPSIRRETLVELSASGDMFLLCRIVKNRETPAEIKHALFSRDEFMLNRALAESPHTPDEILEKLKDSKDRHVLMHLEGNPKVREKRTQQSPAGDVLKAAPEE